MSDITTTIAGGFEVPEPIINGPFNEPTAYWELREGEAPVKQAGRRAIGIAIRKSIEIRPAAAEGSGARCGW
jgi:hypothetical protein